PLPEWPCEGPQATRRSGGGRDRASLSAATRNRACSERPYEFLQSFPPPSSLQPHDLVFHSFAPHRPVVVVNLDAVAHVGRNAKQELDPIRAVEGGEGQFDPVDQTAGLAGEIGEQDRPGV